MGNITRVARVPLALPTTVNQVWTMDYTQDALASVAQTSVGEACGYF